MIMLGKSPELDKEIEEAIKFLVHAIEESGKNPKPVILHSIRVGLYLYHQGYDKEIIIAGILHDLLEDSDTTLEEIKQKFGDKVAKLVEANSFNLTVKDKKERYLGSFTRSLNAGKDALVIKAADFLDNSHYYHLGQDKELYQWLLEKLKHFIDHSEKLLKNETVWKELKNQYNLLTKS